MTPLQALKQCRDALHDVALDCAVECQNAEARDTVGSRRELRIAHAAANFKTLKDALTAADTALAALSEPLPTKVKCNSHPDAPHGFARNRSHTAGRYVCECEGWTPGDKLDPLLNFTTAKQAGLMAGDGKPCINDHDPDCRWPGCNCRASLAPAPRPQPVSPADELPASQGEVPMPEPDGTAEANKIVHPGGGYEFDEVPAWSEKLVRAYGDARALAERERCISIVGTLRRRLSGTAKVLAGECVMKIGHGITAQAQQEGGR